VLFARLYGRGFESPHRPNILPVYSQGQVGPRVRSGRWDCPVSSVGSLVWSVGGPGWMVGRLVRSVGGSCLSDIIDYYQTIV
jgi:hypothetical protein